MKRRYAADRDEESIWSPIYRLRSDDPNPDPYEDCEILTKFVGGVGSRLVALSLTVTRTSTPCTSLPITTMERS
jgi:hypothetical protein